MQEIKLPKLRKIDPNIPKRKKKKILLLSDDLRLHSGIGTMSKEFVIGTVDKYDWVQVGAAINHPDQGKCFDLSEETQKITGVKDASVKIYANSGYGNPQLLFYLLETEKPDAILHFTDPRFWGWLYQMEDQIRQHLPLMYYNIWDDLPYPQWNEDFYESCDLIMNISKQTDNIVKNVLRRYPKEDWAVQYVPHGINENIFNPITPLDSGYKEYHDFDKNFRLKNNNVEFIVFWNNRNIRRKQPGDVILAYKTFCDTLPKEKAEKCLLLMHTQPRDDNGTDLPIVVKTLCNDYKVVFSGVGLEDKKLNYYYNMVDVTINIASNEGFGLSGIESLMAGTPIINNVTGGLQDHCRFEDENGKWIDFTSDFPTNHLGTYKKHGKWVKPVFPSNISCQGSPATPYIFDDRCDFRDVAKAIKYWYDLGKDTRKEYGMAGHDWVCSDESRMSAREMSKGFIKNMETCFEKWKPRKRFTLYKVEQVTVNKTPGVLV